jgi:hypothetical protein
VTGSYLVRTVAEVYELYEKMSRKEIWIVLQLLLVIIIIGVVVGDTGCCFENLRNLAPLLIL